MKTVSILVICLAIGLSYQLPQCNDQHKNPMSKETHRSVMKVYYDTAVNVLLRGATIDNVRLDHDACQPKTTSSEWFEKTFPKWNDPILDWAREKQIDALTLLWKFWAPLSIIFVFLPCIVLLSRIGYKRTPSVYPAPAAVKSELPNLIEVPTAQLQPLTDVREEFSETFLQLITRTLPVSMRYAAQKWSFENEYKCLPSWLLSVLKEMHGDEKLGDLKENIEYLMHQIEEEKMEMEVKEDGVEEEKMEYQYNDGKGEDEEGDEEEEKDDREEEGEDDEEEGEDDEEEDSEDEEEDDSGDEW